MSARQEPTLQALPPIPAKRYFTIGEVSELCGVKPHVLRYWEQEFSQLRPMKRRGNRRYYQHHEVLLVRRIRGLLYEEGFTIAGARNRLGDSAAGFARSRPTAAVPADFVDPAGDRPDSLGLSDGSTRGGSLQRLDAAAAGVQSAGLHALEQQVLPFDDPPMHVGLDTLQLERIREARDLLEAALRILSRE
jgi:DNA-binding transcriptional MerR regulator